MADNEVRVPEKSLREFAERVFVRCGLSQEDAAIEVDCLLWANLRGVDSHGVLRIPSYVERTRKGSMNPKPNIKVLKETPAILMLDADLAFGPVVAVLAMKKTMEKARIVGIGWCLVRNATHVGALGYYSLMAAREGMAGLIVVSSPPNMAPYGARAAGIHNSPISIAVPALRHRPLILDMATSVVAGGKVSLAVDKGVSIPLGWGLDKEGNPTTDPHQATVLLPVGGPKGSGLAVMFECLASVMAGMPLQEPVLRTRQSAWRGSSTRPVQNVLVAAIDISTFTDLEQYKATIDSYIDGIRALPKADGVAEVLVPGEPEDRVYDERSKNGIPLPLGTLQNLKAVAEQLELDFPFKL